MTRAARCILVICLALCVAGCDSQEQVPDAPVERVEAPVESYPLVPVEAPAVPFEEFRLPPRYQLSGYASRFAALVDNDANEGLCALALLDMDSGALNTVLAAPIGLAEGYIALTARCSDEWLAWEEYRGDEQGDGWNVKWSLFAAPIIAGGTAIGEPVLVAESVTSMRSRPLFQVVGSSVYWLTNSSPNPEQEGAVLGSRVEVCDMASGATKDVFATDRFVRSFTVQDDEVILSMYERSGSWAEETLVVALSDGEERFRASFDNAESQVSHWPAYKAGTLLWGELYSTVKSDPRLKILTADGERYLLAEAGSDPCFVDSKVVYESFATHAPAGMRWPAINVLDLDTRSAYVLVQTPGSMNGVSWMLMPGQPRVDSVLVITGNVYGDEASPEVGAWIRRYHL